MSISAKSILADLKHRADPAKAPFFKQYHKVDRVYLGAATPQMDAVAKNMVRAAGPERALELAGELWASDIFEARITAGKVMWQAQVKLYDRMWALIGHWKEDFDSWAIADCVAKGAARCLKHDPARLDEVEGWTCHKNMWVRRAALVFTLDWAKKGRDPDRMLAWAATYVDDKDWFIQKAIAWWLRELSKHNPARVRAFLSAHGNDMAAFARREAGKYLG